MRLARVSQLRVAPCLMMDLKAGSEQDAKYLSWFQDGQIRGHLRGECNTKSLFVRTAFIRDSLAMLSKPLEMAPDRIPCHGACFVERPAVGNQSWQHWYGDLIPRLSRVLDPQSGAAPTASGARRNAYRKWLKNHGETVLAHSKPFSFGAMHSNSHHTALV